MARCGRGGAGREQRQGGGQHRRRLQGGHRRPARAPPVRQGGQRRTGQVGAGAGPENIYRKYFILPRKASYAGSIGPLRERFSSIVSLSTQMAATVSQVP